MDWIGIGFELVLNWYRIDIALAMDFEVLCAGWIGSLFVTAWHWIDWRVKISCLHVNLPILHRSANPPTMWITPYCSWSPNSTDLYFWYLFVELMPGSSLNSIPHFAFGVDIWGWYIWIDQIAEGYWYLVALKILSPTCAHFQALCILCTPFQI